MKGKLARKGEGKNNLEKTSYPHGERVYKTTLNIMKGKKSLKLFQLKETYVTANCDVSTWIGLLGNEGNLGDN